MGICNSSNNDDKKKNKFKKIPNMGKQYYSAPINKYQINNNTSTNLETTMNTASFADVKSLDEFNKKNPSPLYQYNGTYYKRDEQTSLMTVSLHEMQGNSLTNNKGINSRTNQTKVSNSIYACIDETENESSNEVLEIISDGKMNESLLQKSTDQTTIDSFNEFIGRRERKTAKKKNIDIYFKKRGVKNNNNNKLKKNDDNKDDKSIISGIHSTPFNNFKFQKK